MFPCGTTFCFLNISCARALTCKINGIAYPEPHSLEVFPSLPLPFHPQAWNHKNEHWMATKEKINFLFSLKELFKLHGITDTWNFLTRVPRKRRITLLNNFQCHWGLPEGDVTGVCCSQLIPIRLPHSPCENLQSNFKCYCLILCCQNHPL